MPRCLQVLVCLLLGAAAALAQNPSGRPQPESSGQAPEYSVAGLALGARVKPDSPEYQGYRCGPSDQFPGFTSCRKIRQERSAGGSFNAMYSFLHARDGTVVYVDRYQDPAFLDASAAEEEIRRYSDTFRDAARITRNPERPGAPAGILAAWGKIVLEPLGSESLKALAQGRNPGPGYLIDFIGDFARSGKEGLPVYQIGGGAGFVWVASFDQRSHGILRIAAADTSLFQSDRARGPKEP